MAWFSFLKRWLDTKPVAPSKEVYQPLPHCVISHDEYPPVATVDPRAWDVCSDSAEKQ